VFRRQGKAKLAGEKVNRSEGYDRYRRAPNRLCFNRHFFGLGA
jgi:hypothetical protein